MHVFAADNCSTFITNHLLPSGKTMATNAVYPPFYLDRAGLDFISTYCYASLPLIHWLVQVVKTQI